MGVAVGPGLRFPYDPSEEEEEAFELKEEGSDLETEAFDLERKIRLGLRRWSLELRLAASFISEKKIKRER